MTTSSNRFKMIASVYLLLVRDNKILLQRRQNTGYEDGNYGLPAGHVDKDETLTKAILREVKEETDIDLDKSGIKLVHIMHRKKDDIRLDFFYTSDSYGGKIKNAEPEKCDDLAWFPIDDLPLNTIPYIRSAINYYLNKIQYSEFGWK